MMYIYFIISFNMFNKFFIIWNLINFAFIPLFFYDLFMMWFFMEINNFLFICYLCMKLTNKKIIFMYYIIQVIASLMLIFSLITNTFFFYNNSFFNLNFLISMMLKLGIPPFHLWMPLISLFMSWDTLFILLTIQKIIPFYMLSIIEVNIMFMYFMILSSSFMSTFKMINLLNFKMLLTYSSINQTSWMLLLIFLKNLFWLIYMFIYSLILLIICIFFYYFKMSSNFFFNNFSSLNLNLICLMLSFNLASIPPLSFFFMKWMSIFIFILNSNLHLIFILMMINSFILIYIYINLMNLTMFLFMFKSKLFNNYSTKFNFINFKKLPLLLYFGMILSLMIFFF
uniref:NADH dehydrogenase subunit 2 n=1 Tax=Formica candida TaxID=299549 RepID=UPI0022F2B1A8|nr:NADH dehydrogenase subunit 2 [Formica candida]WAK85248.1 NADH dehydrogenase subunit 2 [Formica candida]WLN31356.1 NADH dehydrogenase subunit 2 [Formica candida]